MTGWRLDRNRSRLDDVRRHLMACDACFTPPLSLRVALPDYAAKLVSRAERFEAWSGSSLVGLVAVYCNAPERQRAFVTSVSVAPERARAGIGQRLLEAAIADVSGTGFRWLDLSVDRRAAARGLYARLGFATRDETGETLHLSLDLGRLAAADAGSPGEPTMQQLLRRGRAMSETRDFDLETKDVAGHRYAYDFDLDVMHKYMVRAFEPFFRAGRLLELGSFQGDFTRRLTPFFDDVTCVEASGEAIAVARTRLDPSVRFIHATFETVALPVRYDTAVLTHVLEHLDDPVAVLARVRNEWLSDGGRLLVTCPNANAPSRQIAVKMGLIPHNDAVTDAERQHGHRCTYTLDTLERDARAAGLRVIHRSGVFFKALANFQWDALLKTDIVSPAYLDGCYELGQIYPDLCASIFLVCER